MHARGSLPALVFIFGDFTWKDERAFHSAWHSKGLHGNFFFMSHPLNLAFNLVHFLAPQPKEGGDVTEESHKQAVRKRRVRKDWRRRTPRLLSPFSPDAEEVEGPSPLLLPTPLAPSGRAEQHVFPPNHLVACSHPGCPIHCLGYTHPRPAVSQTTSRLALSCLSLPPARWPIRWIPPPGDFVHLAVFPSSIPSFHAFFILLLFAIAVKMPVSLRKKEKKRPPLSTCVPVPPVSAVKFSLWIHQRTTSLSPPESEGSRESTRAHTAAVDPRSYRFTAYHRGYISELKTLFSCPLFWRTCSRTQFDKVPSLSEIVRVSWTGQQERTPGRWRCPCRVGICQLISRLSLVKVYLW